MEEWVMIRNLYKQGVNKTKIAFKLNIDRKTVTKYLKDETKPKYVRKKGESKLDGYKNHIIKRLGNYNLSSSKIYEEIQNMGFDGKYGIVNIFTRSLKKELEKQAYLRFETLPGEQAQVDWGICEGIYDEEQKKNINVNCFIMVLGFSRAMYIDFFENQKTESFLEGHNNAFEYFGGYTKEILYDNLKSVVIKRRLKAKDSEFNKRFMDFAGYYGFLPILARPYKPTTKGKVEAAVNYVKNNFIAGEQFKSLREIKAKSKIWLDKVNNRNHCTIHEKPFERLKRENLISIKHKKIYDIFVADYRKVQKDCYFSYKNNFYSVPYKYANTEVTIKNIDDKLIIKYRDEIIAEHKLSYGRFQYITDEKHFKELRDLKLQEYNNCNFLKPKSMIEEINFDVVEPRDLKRYEEVLK